MKKTIAAITGLVAAGTSALSAQKPSDVVLIMTDQQTASAMSCAGNPWVHTPNMDALASDGVRFTRAYSPFPVSGPCRASIMTGRYPAEIGARDNGVRPSQEAMDAGLGHVLSAAGYECLYAGKWHVTEINVPESSGFRKLCDMDDREIADACMEALKQRDKSKPLFLVASYLDPHEICEFARDESLPYGPLPAFSTQDCPNLPANFMPSTYQAEALSLERGEFLKSYDTWTYTQDDWRRYLWGYYRLVERVDERIGELVGVLKKCGVYDNAIIVFCSDHGDGAAAHGWNQKWALFEECINVPLIVKAPGLKQGSLNSGTLVNIGTDIYATACSAAGLGVDEKRYEGISLVKAAKGRQTRSSVVVETFLSGTGVRGWAVVEGRYKYTLYQYYQNREALYDLSCDPGEMLNLAVDKAYSDKIVEMRGELMKWAEKTSDAKLLKQLRTLGSDSESGHIKGNWR